MTLLLILFIMTMPSQAMGADDHDTVVKTDFGKVRGYISDGTIIWKGVPYAAPPVGDLRWRPSQEPASWHGVRDAVAPANKCTQLVTTTEWLRTGAAEGSEDCLYVDIYRPQRPAHHREKLPVYVWIHGGSNNFGSAQQYDGAALAKKSDVVVVIVQYRLGPMGWFYYPNVQTGGADMLADSGNYGTLDHARALRWIHKNIDAFGGDPETVLLAGESAGSHNTMNMVISPQGRHLFHRALSESGGMQTITPAAALTQAQGIIEQVIRSKENVDAATAKTRRLAMEADGTIQTYLRGTDAKDFFLAIFKYTGTMPTFSAIEDGTVLPAGGWIPAIRSGNYNKVPIILGANEYESKSFMPLYGPSIKPLGVPTGTKTWFNLIDVMRGTTNPSYTPHYTVADVLPTLDDVNFYQITGYYGSRNWRAKYVDTVAHELAQVQNHVYAYLFKWGGDGSGPYPFSFIYGPGHAAEIPFFFGGSAGLFGYGFTSENEAGRKDLQNSMMAYIANFIREGDPNAHHLPKWHKWTNTISGPKMILFDANLNKALLSMSSEEITIEGVTAELNAAISGYSPYWQAAARAFQFSKPW
jgi:para-nitrobenzyl esterase